MFGFKSFLRVGALEDASIIGLYRDSYELQNCSYEFFQEVDLNGKPQHEVMGGTIFLTYGNTPPMELWRWMLKSNAYEDGMIVICDENDKPSEKIIFENAACVGLEVNYLQKGKTYISTKITLRASSIRVGTVTVENKWQ